MPELSRIWVGMLTRDSEDAGTDSGLTLSINDEQIHIFDAFQDDQERGKADLYERDVAERRIFTENLGAFSIRVVIRGDDQWSPHHVFVWGETDEGDILPLAIETDMEPMSTDRVEGDPVSVVRVAGRARGHTITRLLFLMKTSRAVDVGTDGRINLTLRNNAGLPLADFDIPDTSQDEQERGKANMYFVPADVPFTRDELDRATLSINGDDGDDAWLPEGVFLFGLDGTDTQRPTVVSPLVHIPNWTEGHLSSEDSEGTQRVILPLL